MDCNHFFVRQRVILDERHLGTLRFCGTIEGEDPNQTWLGIEWDDPSRGRHSGQFKNGPVLFQTLIPNSGTFMKPSKRLETGRSFLSALKEKYVDEDLLNSTPNSVKRANDIQAEEDGMRKVARCFSQLDRLRLIGLESSKIKSAGNDREIEELEGLLPSVETLNLSSNMFSDFTEVSTIAGKLPRLKTLVLSSNRFEYIPETISGLCSIEILYLDSTLFTWQQGVKVASQVQALTELSLSNCRIAHFSLGDFPTYVPSFESLSVLSLDENGLANWQDLMLSLKLFPQLQNLNLRRNRLQISPLEDQTMVRGSVHHLSLVGNLISQGGEIDYLRDWFPELSSLFLDGNPLYDAQDVRKNRLLALGRYPTLVLLDGSQVTPAERMEADLFYWSIIHKDTDDDQRHKSHRRYPELLAKFGQPESESRDTRASSLKAKMLNLTVIWPERELIDRQQHIEVLPSMTARGLTMYLVKMIRRGFQSTKSVPELLATLEVRVTDKTNLTGLVVDLSDPQKDLGWLGISDGDTLEVSF